MADDGLARLHASRSSESDTLDTIVGWAHEVAGCTDVGIFMLRDKGAVETMLPTSERVEHVHQLQIELGEGPCLEVLKDDDVDGFVIGDTRSDRRFQIWGPAAADLGLHSVISAVLETKQKRFGSLNLYAEEPHVFDRDDFDVVRVFAERAARAMTVAEEKANMYMALDTRRLIGVAQGILMERLSIGEDVASKYMVRESQARNVKLRFIAEWIVANHGQLPLSELDV